MEPALMSSSLSHFHKLTLWILPAVILVVIFAKLSGNERKEVMVTEETLQAEARNPEKEQKQFTVLTPQAAAGLARTMTREDPAKAARWLQKLGDDPELDSARVEFLNEAGTHDFEMALEQVETLSNQDQRDHFYRRILKSWVKEDRESAIDWAKENVVMLPRQVYRNIVPGN